MNLIQRSQLRISKIEEICDENDFGNLFRVLKTVVLVIFYPVALESINEVTEVANEMDCSEYDIFERFGNPGEITHEFGEYLKTGKIPPMLRQKCRNYLEFL